MGLFVYNSKYQEAINENRKLSEQNAELLKRIADMEKVINDKGSTISELRQENAYLKQLNSNIDNVQQFLYKMYLQLESYLKEQLNTVINNETYAQIKELYSKISVDEILFNLKNGLDKFQVFIEIATLVERYKNNSEYIKKYKRVAKLINLFVVIDNSISFNGLEKENLNALNEEQIIIKQKLKKLGVNNLNMIEGEKQTNKKTSTLNKKLCGDSYDKLFMQSNNFSELLDLYCYNTKFRDGMDRKRLETVHRLFLSKCKDTPHNFDMFKAHVHARYYALQLNE